MAIEEANRRAADTAVVADMAKEAETRVGKDPAARQVEGESVRGRAEVAAAVKVKVAEDRMAGRVEPEATAKGRKGSYKG